jgi:uncharacterized protein (TIGR02996 family)
MTSEESSLAAILENPDDDALRLIYADWLEEHGQPERAELIRVQCRVACEERSGNWNPDDVRELKLRVDELLDAHKEKWTAGVKVPGVDWIEFRRGFPEHLILCAEAFVKDGRRFTEQTPLSSVTLHNVAGHAEQLASCSHLRAIKHVTIQDGRLGDEDVVALSLSPHFSKLMELILEGDRDTRGRTEVGNEGLRHVASASFAPQLTRLEVASDGRLGSWGVAAMAAQMKDTQLEDLALTHGCIDDEGVEILRAMQGLRGVDWLNLFDNHVTDAGLIALLTSPVLESVTRVWVAFNRVTGSAFLTLAGEKAQFLPHLSALSLSGNPIASVDVGALSTFMKGRRQLRLTLDFCPLPSRLRREIKRLRRVLVSRVG